MCMQLNSVSCLWYKAQASSNKQLLKLHNETNIYMEYRDVRIKTLPKPLNHQNHSPCDLNFQIGIFFWCILMEPDLQNWTCQFVIISQPASHFPGRVMQMYSLMSGWALKSRCIQTKGAKRLRASGRGCNSELVKRKLALKKDHESRRTRSRAISLEVRAQCANMPQNATNIKAWKWIN